MLLDSITTVGWRCWYDDGSVHTGLTFDDWVQLAASKSNMCLIKMIYYDNGTKQIQTMDWWYEVEHESGIIRAACHDNKKADIEILHPEAVFIEGFWTTDEWFHECVDAAMTSVWNDGNDIRAN